MTSYCEKCNKPSKNRLCKKCADTLEKRIEAGRQANSEYRGDTPPTWSQRLSYGFSMLEMDGDFT